jgi:tripartite-type tricarboxylate transporter receptor subunit TctC
MEENMKKTMLIFSFTLLSALLVFAGGGAEEEWPTKTIQVYIPFGAGGDTDLHARTISDLVAKELGVPIVCTNMTGQAGIVAARHVKNSPNDGYSILFQQSSFLVASAIGLADFDYTDFEIAGTICEDNFPILFVNKKLNRYPDMASFIKYGKDNPGALLFATTIGGFSQLQGEAVADALGIDITSVDLGGTTEVIPSVLTGDTDFVIGIYGTFNPYLKSGDFAALAVCGPKRFEGLPDVPSISEFGADFRLTKLFGFYFPKDTDPAIVKEFSAALKKAVNSDEFAAHCKKFYVTPIYRGGEECLEYHNEQYAIIGKYKHLLMAK